MNWRRFSKARVDGVYSADPEKDKLQPEINFLHAGVNQRWQRYGCGAVSLAREKINGILIETPVSFSVS